MAQTDQRAAGYLPPDQGPFHCGGCEYFRGPSSCALVSGTIAPDGCCNLYEKGKQAAVSSLARLHARAQQVARA